MATREKLNRVKLVLGEKEMTQTELAAKLNRSVNTINRICQNVTQPNLHLLKEIADILDVDMRDLIVSTKKKA